TTWNMNAPMYHILHHQCAAAWATARANADTIAERTATIVVPADARATTIAKETRVTPVDAGWVRDDDVVATFVRIYAEMIERLRQRAADVEKPDPVTNDILLDLLQDLEKQYWMWQAQTV